jgi:hypothetical protein
MTAVRGDRVTNQNLGVLVCSTFFPAGQHAILNKKISILPKGKPLSLFGETVVVESPLPDPLSCVLR